MEALMPTDDVLALFVWKSGFQEERSIAVDANRLPAVWEIAILKPSRGLEMFDASAPIPGERGFSKVSFRLEGIVDGRVVYVSDSGEEPWMRCVLKRDKLKRELAELEMEMLDLGLL
jgi:hypothetical protein